MGRIPEYTAELAEKILVAISEGETLKATCRKLDISHSTVLQWVRDDREGFANLYARSRQLQVEAWADLIVAEAEDSSKDTVTLTRRDGTEYEAPDHEWISRSRLRVDTYKWLMSKLSKKYADKVEQTQIHEIGDTLKNEIARVRAQNGQ